MSDPLLAEIFALSSELIETAGKAGLTVGTAESCTGGLVGAAITAKPGSSKIFHGGIIAYDNRLKTKLLGVPPSALGKYGAVSRVVAERMAAGCVERLDVDLAVSLTGIAGPGGGSADKPVGTVYIGIANRTSATAMRYDFPDERRNRVRDRACIEAMKLLIQVARL